jgi:deoxycytidylate deaminase
VSLIIPSALAPILKGKDSVLYVGENQRREMIGKLYQRSLHAEVNALFKSIKHYDKTYSFKRKGKPDRPAMTLYVVRILNGHCASKCYTLGMCRPCLNCQNILFYYNVTRIKYTDIIDGVNVLCEMRANKNYKMKNITYKITRQPEYD